MAEKKYTIINGDSAQELKQIPDNTIDAVITDPPYGIEFLGKDWDSNTGAVAIWAECHRILKPGGHLLAFSAARTYHHLATNIETVGFEIRDQLMWIYSSGFPKAQDIGKALDKRGITNQSHGWKTALKPGHEPIVMARKRFKGSTMDNIQHYGVGALNIDATRIESEPFAYCADGLQRTTYSQSEPSKWNDSDKTMIVNNKGRYPSNVLGDIPAYQKYFYCAKVSRRERHTGFDTKTAGNNHPTVKPVALMRYLIELVTPAHSHIVDPFTGSGTTGMAAVELGHRFTGIEQDPAYVEIANRRIEGWSSKDTAQDKEHTATDGTQPFDRLFEHD